MPVIEVKNLSKSFKIYSDKGRTLKERLLFRKRRTFEKRSVLKNITFEIKKGETVGLIGHNGCGKSTLLKLLTRILYPEQGTIKIDGRVSSLLELGAGFHPDLSGRENIYANAAVFGLKKKEVDDRIHSIIEFSELEAFIDNPVRTYSSGMYTRLAFSVAISVNADILLVDEILAVGDINFQQKCLKRMRQLRDSGVTIVFVTHDSNTVKSFCSRAIWIHDGEIRKDGSSAEAVDAYLAFMNESKRQQMLKEEESNAEREAEEIAEEIQNEEIEDTQINESEEDTNHFGSGDALIKSAYFLNSKNRRTTILEQGEKVTIEINYEIKKPQSGYNFGTGFYTAQEELVFGTNMNIDNIFPVEMPSRGCVRFIIDKFPLLEGEYKLNIAIVNDNQEPLDYYRFYSDFNVTSENHAIGVTYVNHEWVLPEGTAKK